MALTQTNATNEPRAISLGVLKMQLIAVQLVSGDTACAVTFDGLSTVKFALLTGFVESAAPTYATNVATFTVVDPVATRMGQAVGFGV